MKCPNCQTENNAAAKFCTSCGAPLAQAGSAGSVEAVKTAASAGLVFGKKARQIRLNTAVDPNTIISDRAYNGTIAVVLLWGLLINYLLCSSESVVYGFTRFFASNPTLCLIGYLVLVLAGIFIAAKSHNPLVSFLGYNLVVVPFGLIISVLVLAYGGIGSAVVSYAFLYTLLISTGMMACVMIAPGFFSKLGGALAGVLIGLVVCEVVLLILGVKQSVTDWLAAGLFSLYIGYDIYRSQQFPKTLDNAVDSALDIYMDVANLFIRILSIMGKRRD